jgi:hypothetical protein
MELQQIPINIGNVSDGAMVEAFEMELAKVMLNICDLATKAAAPRVITLTLKMVPKDDRIQIDTEFSCVSKLAPIAEHTSRMYLGKGTDGGVYAFAEDPRQQILFRPPAPKEENIVTFSASK